MDNFFADYPVTGGGVTSLNGLTGALTLVGAGGITITPSGTTITITGTGGTVTSVGLADSTGLFNITGSPVTTSGTLTLASFKSQSANTFLAAPNGSAGAPTFRTIVAADIPSLAYANQSLSNLTNPTAVNQSLIPGADATYALGGSSARWAGVNTTSVTNPGGALGLVGSQINAFNSLYMVTGNSLFFQSNTGGNTVSFSAANSLAATTAYVLPIAYPSANGASLTSTTAGTMSWISQLPLTGGTLSGALNMGSNQINALANGTLTTDAVNLGQLQAAISGLYWQGPAKAYAASNVPLAGSTPLVIDGYTVLNGDLLILGNQTTASQNGEYSAAITGGTYVLTANGLPTAAGDAWLILNGTTYGDSAFVANAAVPSATFTEFAGPTAYTFSSPLLLTGRTVSISQANTSTSGYLSSTDWNTFNNKQAAGNYITALTGDGTASGPGSVAFTLATVNSSVGSFGSSTAIPSFTVNAKGLITAASTNPVIAPAGTLSGTTLNATVVSSSLNVVGTITSGVWQGTPVAIAYGGTGTSTTSQNFAFIGPTSGSGAPSFRAIVPGDIPTLNQNTTGTAAGLSSTLVVGSGGTGQTSFTANGVLYGNGTSGLGVTGTGTSGQVLTSNGSSSAPTFQTPSFSPKAPTIQQFTSGSGTYTLPSGPAPLYIRVVMVGGGAGGTGSGTNVGGPTGSGVATTFGTSLLVANGGNSATLNNSSSPSTASLGSGPIGIAIGGAGGSSGMLGVSGNNTPGAPGASSFFGGAGTGDDGSTGGNAVANTGSGGAGGGMGAAGTSGSGGGAGAYVDAIITSPSSTYSYAVGSGGTGGSNGSLGMYGGNGAAGLITVYEYYQ